MIYSPRVVIKITENRKYNKLNREHLPLQPMSDSGGVRLKHVKEVATLLYELISPKSLLI